MAQTPKCEIAASGHCERGSEYVPPLFKSRIIAWLRGEKPPEGHIANRFLQCHTCPLPDKLASIYGSVLSKFPEYMTSQDSAIFEYPRTHEPAIEVVRGELIYDVSNAPVRAYITNLQRNRQQT